MLRCGCYTPELRSGFLAMIRDILPISGPCAKGEVTVEGSATPADKKSAAGFLRFLPGYFRAMGIPLVSGRDFHDLDGGEGDAVVIVTRALFARLFPGRDPIGQRIKVGPPESEPWLRVAGVLGDSGVASPAPSADDPYPDFRASVAGDHGLGSVRRDRHHRRTERTREMGLRSALGAGPTEILRFALGQGFAPIGAGLALGLGFSAAMAPALRGLLYGLEPLTPGVHITAALGLAFIALCASLGPARRALRLSPLEALNQKE